MRASQFPNALLRRRRSGLLAFVLLALQLAPGLRPTAQAYPPAPYHLIYGEVRDRYGMPLTSAQAQIIFQTQSGIQISGPVLPGFSAGVNYLLKIPMDAGQSPDLYQPNAQFAATPFKLMVVIGTVTNFPMEITNYVTLGQPAGRTRIDLTLGVDSNGDGIPDAWEYAFLASLGLNLPLSSLNANSVLTPDGRTLRQQYLLGTYPFDPGDPLLITFQGFNGPSPVLSFPTVTGHSYTVLASTDLTNWSPAVFNLASEAPGSPTHEFYYAAGIATVQVYVAPPPPGTTQQFYKIQVQ